MAEGRREGGYVPGPDFIEETRESLYDFQMNDDCELWLVQLPDDHIPDFDGQEISLNLDQDEMGSLKGADGKVYSLVNFPADVAEATLFQPSPSGTKIVGNISRHVSLVHFPEPDELVAKDSDIKKQLRLSSKTTFTKTHFSTPSRSTIHQNVQSQSKHSSRKHSKGAAGEMSSKHKGQSVQHSGRSNSGITLSGSSEQSHPWYKNSADPNGVGRFVKGFEAGVTQKPDS